MSTTPAWADRSRRSRTAEIDLKTFDERWAKTHSSPETLRKYRGYADLFMEWADRYTEYSGIDILKEVGLAELEDYFDYLTSEHWDGHPGPCVSECGSLPYEIPSLKAKYDALSSYFGYAIVHQLRGTNPVKGIKLDPRTRKKRMILLPWEIHDVVGAARQESIRAAITTGFFFGPGVRCEEVERIDIERLYQVPRGRMLRLRRKGKNRWQDIDVPHPLNPLIDELIDGRTHGPLVMSTGRRTRNKETGELEHTRLDSSGLWRMVKRAGEACGFDISPHDGRATSITLSLVDPNQPSIDRVMTYYDHHDLDVTLGYRNADRLPSGFHRNPFGIDWKTQAP
ncbi:tyrosine-type recombinase/integrase [Streptomyces sp. NPDC059080]|uniref:tyrosine-type recombinase/integrase n=1 Tax=Streptomyces sp. NPDC059080 TaxID=3346718 RepID=UPI0036848ECC